ncbi:MAG: rhodanese-like domain-containing protein [Bacteriovoracaceae bacterium]|nr:rhodanese-like domain-containing protein [Bacteriovoracaceae bacterium]
MKMNVFESINIISERLDDIEKRIGELEKMSGLELSIIRNHLVRVKNGEPLDDHFLLTGAPYRDISPGDAIAIYQNPDSNYFFLDVTEAGFNHEMRIEEAINIPLSELPRRFTEINKDKAIPIMVISENGLGSIHACELLTGKGYYNLNNISGGYEHWQGIAGNRPIPSNY